MKYLKATLKVAELHMVSLLQFVMVMNCDFVVDYFKCDSSTDEILHLLSDSDRIVLRKHSCRTQLWRRKKKTKRLKLQT